MTVGKIEAVEALCFHKLQQTSTTEPQLIQQESVGNNKILRVSITSGIWFGTRGSEVQILSPRPIFSSRYSVFTNRPKTSVDEIVDGQSLKFQRAVHQRDWTRENSCQRRKQTESLVHRSDEDINDVPRMPVFLASLPQSVVAPKHPPK